jgi:hypothetical protein
MIVASLREGAALSRFGPILPTAPAAFNVWQAPQVCMKDVLPALALPMSLGFGPV